MHHLRITYSRKMLRISRQDKTEISAPSPAALSRNNSNNHIPSHIKRIKVIPTVLDYIWMDRISSMDHRE
jgi:hypothetical protein